MHNKHFRALNAPGSRSLQLCLTIRSQPTNQPTWPFTVQVTTFLTGEQGWRKKSYSKKKKNETMEELKRIKEKGMGSGRQGRQFRPFAIAVELWTNGPCQACASRNVIQKYWQITGDHLGIVKLLTSHDDKLQTNDSSWYPSGQTKSKQSPRDYGGIYPNSVRTFCLCTSTLGYLLKVGLINGIDWPANGTGLERTRPSAQLLLEWCQSISRSSGEHDHRSRQLVGLQGAASHLHQNAGEFPSNLSAVTNQLSYVPVPCQPVCLNTYLGTFDKCMYCSYSETPPQHLNPRARVEWIQVGSVKGRPKQIWFWWHFRVPPAPTSTLGYSSGFPLSSYMYVETQLNWSFSQNRQHTTQQFPASTLVGSCYVRDLSPHSHVQCTMHVGAA